MEAGIHHQSQLRDSSKKSKTQRSQVLIRSRNKFEGLAHLRRMASAHVEEQTQRIENGAEGADTKIEPIWIRIRILNY